jgi:cobalt-zinc-cadmium efflux system outer membrane protein
MLAVGLSTALAFPPSDHPQAPAPEPLTLAEAEQVFTEHGFDLIVAEANALGAEGDVISQSSSANPTFSGAWLSSGAVPQAQFVTTPGYSLGLTDNAALFDILWGKKFLRRDVAAAALRAARAGKDDALRNLRFQLESAFVAALLARDNLLFAREVLKTYEDTLRLNELRYEQGAIGAADVARVATAKGEAEQAVEQAIQAEIQARAALLVFLGPRDPGASFEPKGALSYRPEAAPPDAADPGKLIVTALTARPDVRVALASREQAEKSVALAKRQRIPDVTLSGGYSTQVNLQSSPPTVVSPPNYQLGLSFPLPVFYRQKGEIVRAEQNLRSAAALEQKSHAQVASDVAAASAAVVSTRRQVERMEGDLLGHAQKARDAEKILYEKGAASLLDFLDAERTYVATNVEHQQDLANYWTAIAQLHQAVGDLATIPLPEER